MNEEFVIDKLCEIIHSNDPREAAIVLSRAFLLMSNRTSKNIREQRHEWWVETANISLDVACAEVFG